MKSRLAGLLCLAVLMGTLAAPSAQAYFRARVGPYRTNVVHRGAYGVYRGGYGPVRGYYGHGRTYMAPRVYTHPRLRYY